MRLLTSDGDDRCRIPGQPAVDDSPKPHQPIDVLQLEPADGSPLHDLAAKPPARTRNAIKPQHGFNDKACFAHALSQLLFRIAPVVAEFFVKTVVNALSLGNKDHGAAALL